MSGRNKRGGSVILIICIVFLIVGVAGVIVASGMGENELRWGMAKQIWETVALACLNAGWIGALIVYWTDIRSRKRR